MPASTPKAQLKTLRAKWDRDYTDVPWLSNELLVAVSPEFAATAFEFIFEGVEQMPTVELIWSADAEAVQGEPRVEVTALANAIGINLKLLNFDSSLLQGFRIKQVAPIRQSNVACLQYDGQQDNWMVVYSSHERTKELRQQVHQLLDSESHQALRQLIDTLLSRDIKKAQQLLDADLQFRNKAEAEPWLTSRFELDYVLHGLKRTFRYWTDDEKQLYLQDALDVINALQPLSTNTCVFGGAALGFVRQGELLAHDDDLDVVICLDRAKFPDIGTALEAVTKTLVAAGLEIKGTFFSQLWVGTRSNVAPTLDVFIGLVEDDGISCYPMPRRALSMQKMFPAQDRPLHGKSIPMPRDITHYLEVDYGRNWQTPDPGHSIEWDRSPYADIAGKRTSLPMSTRRELAFMRQLAWIA